MKNTKWIAAIAALMTLPGVAAPKKPAVKPAVPAANQNKAQSQQKGGPGVFGETYTLGGGYENWNVTIVSAANSIAPQPNGQVVGQDERFLVLRVRIKNANNRPSLFPESALPLVAVDSAGKNYEELPALFRDADHKVADMEFRPGQGLDDLSCAWKIPADATITKIILNVGRKTVTGEKVVRYVIAGTGPEASPKNILAPLPAPYADPADKTGQKAAKSYPAELGKEYTMLGVGVTVEKFSFAAKLGGIVAEDGKRLLVGQAKLRNLSHAEVALQDLPGVREGFSGVVTDGDDDEIKCEFAELHKAVKDEPLGEKTLGAGKDVTVRFAMQVPKSNKPLKSLKLSWQETPCHAPIFDLGMVK